MLSKESLHAHTLMIAKVCRWTTECSLSEIMIDYHSTHRFMNSINSSCVLMTMVSLEAKPEGRSPWLIEMFSPFSLTKRREPVCCAPVQILTYLGFLRGEVNAQISLFWNFLILSTFSFFVKNLNEPIGIPMIKVLVVLVHGQVEDCIFTNRRTTSTIVFDARSAVAIFPSQAS